MFFSLTLLTFQVKRVGETRKFLVGWGHEKERMIFFLSHPGLDGKGSEHEPIPISSDKTGDKLVELAREIDRKR